MLAIQKLIEHINFIILVYAAHHMQKAVSEYHYHIILSCSKFEKCQNTAAIGGIICSPCAHAWQFSI